jgi:nucleotide-binding universal stress UspA family protein
MTVAVAVADSPEGRYALTAAIAEAETLNTDVIAINLGLRPLGSAASSSESGVAVSVVERRGRDDRDLVEAVLHEIAEHSATRLVIGIKRRSPVSKMILGSISQRLILDSPVPVLTVKVPE